VLSSIFVIIDQFFTSSPYPLLLKGEEGKIPEISFTWHISRVFRLFSVPEINAVRWNYFFSC